MGKMSNNALIFTTSTSIINKVSLIKWIGEINAKNVVKTYLDNDIVLSAVPDHRLRHFAEC